MDLLRKSMFSPGRALLMMGLAALAGCSDGDDKKPVVDAAVVIDTSPDPGWDVDAGACDGDDGGCGVVAATESFWTIAVLPDTQYSYYQSPPYFDSETRWIADNHQAERIAFALHEGDIVDTPWDPSQWASARASMSLLDGKVPYVVSVGNHDIGSEDRKQERARETIINNYFLDSDAAKAPLLGGLYEPGHIENAYYLLQGGGRTWLVLSLEFGPRPGVVTWANQVLTEHAQLPAILLTHAYLYSDNTPYNYLGRACNFGTNCTNPDPPGANTQCWNPKCYDGISDGADGKMLWDELVSLHSNLLFVFSGHVANGAPFNTARLTSTRADGSICHQIMADYQADEAGGNGYFRLVRFWPDGTVRVRTFSAYTSPDKAVLTDDHNQFTLHVQLPAAAAL
jgi:hypothetical protein